MREKLYYDKAGNVLGDVMEWARLLENKEYQRVALTEISEGVTVSTVWLGLDHQWADGPPLIFETMIFGGPEEGYCERYSTEAEALAGHEVACERARASR